MVLAVLGNMIGPFVAIFLLIKSGGESDPVIKTKTKKLALWSFIGPILFVFLLMTLWGITRIIFYATTTTTIQ